MNPTLSNLPSPPDTMNGSNVLLRLVDALSFRYYWATENLSNADYDFRPSKSSMNMRELMEHILHLANASHRVLQDLPFEKPSPPSNNEDLRAHTLELFQQCRHLLSELSDSELEAKKIRPANRTIEFPIWNLINGPLADALTHIGQITTWRRTNGNPVPPHDPFTGTAH